MANKKWEDIAEYADKSKDMLFVVASPKSDEIFASFGGLTSFVKFPMTDMSKGVVFNALRKSKFEEAIEPFIVGLMEMTGFKETEEGAQLLKLIGGQVKSLGVGGVKEVKNK